MKSTLLLSLLILTSTAVKAESENYSIKVLTGNQMYQVLPFVCQCWTTIFNQYPYLYVGTAEEGDEYFDWLSKSSESAIAVAYLDNNPVGFLVGTSFIKYGEHAQGSIDLFEQAGLDSHHYYYFCEIIVVPEHRGHGLSKKLSKALEQHAFSLGYTRVCFVTESHEYHPLKPKNYRELNNLWAYLGCTKINLSIPSQWQTIQEDGTVKEQVHHLTYWVKDFTQLNH